MLLCEWIKIKQERISSTNILHWSLDDEKILTLKRTSKGRTKIDQNKRLGGSGRQEGVWWRKWECVRAMKDCLCYCIEKRECERQRIEDGLKQEDYLSNLI